MVYGISKGDKDNYFCIRIFETSTAKYTTFNKISRIDLIMFTVRIFYT